MCTAVPERIAAAGRRPSGGCLHMGEGLLRLRAAASGGPCRQLVRVAVYIKAIGACGERETVDEMAVALCTGDGSAVLRASLASALDPASLARRERHPAAVHVLE